MEGRKEGREEAGREGEKERNEGREKGNGSQCGHLLVLSQMSSHEENKLL